MAPAVTAVGAAVRRSLRGDGLRMLMQPIIDLRTGEVPGVEALARLVLDDRPDHVTVVGPVEFLPLLDDSDLDFLFRAGLDRALAAVAGWEEGGLRLNVGVNLEPSTLRDPRCADWVAALLDRYSLDGERVILELLETDVLDAPVQLESLVRLCDLGVAVAVDDFGTGYSTAERLAALPVAIVKVDRELTAGLGGGPAPAFDAVAELIELGRASGCDVVVEGIEDAAQAEAARRLGASHGQGYLFARPMPADEVPDWVAGFRANGVAAD